ncbi:MAG: hypothetical protein FWH48_05290, partial [Oscillospiraceae bacterium]|nr:hypothetical protein [Oscillospiraceae bacterium]
SCAESKKDDTGEKPETTSGTDAANEDAANKWEEAYPYPEHDFGGETLNVLVRKDGWYDGSQDIDDITVETLSGEIFGDAVYERTKKVEEKYNFQIKTTPVQDPTGTVQKTVKAGEDVYQLIQEKLMFMSQTLVPQNYLLDLKTVLEINLDAPWYNQHAVKDLSINNKLASIGGDMTVNDKGGVIMVTYSKKLAEQYGLENLYTTVNEGKWTLDKMYELMMATTADINGDGKLTVKDDQWGLVCEDYGGWMLSAASGNRLADLDSDGLPYITCLSEKNVGDYEKIKKLMYEKDGRATIAEDDEHVRIFVENRCFLSIDMLSSIVMLRGMEEDFGIIPMPKQNESQKDYISTISPWVSRFIAIPSTCKNVEMAGAAIDALSRESADTVVPAYYDNLLNQKIARDEESIEMLKQIFSSVIYDIGAVFNWGGIWDQQHTFFSTKKEDYVSFHEKIMGKIEADLAKTIETIQQFN